MAERTQQEPVTTAPAGRGRRGPSVLRELPVLILIALLLALALKTFVVQAFFIPSGSMEQTLHIGDRVLVNKLVYDVRSIHRGEVVVFKVPPSWEPESTQSAPSNVVVRVVRDIGSWVGFAQSSNRIFIKRVIGLPGDVVQCNAQDHIVVNGHVLVEPYVYPGEADCGVGDVSGHFTVRVPKGRLWVMGDHREDSSDSRAHMDDHLGTVPEANVVGRAFVIVWPPNRVNDLPVPRTFTAHAAGLAGAAGLLSWVWVRRRRV